MFNTISGNRSTLMDKDWEERENRFRGGPLPTDPLTTGVVVREALGHDVGGVNKVEIDGCGEGYDREYENNGGRAF